MNALPFRLSAPISALMLGIAVCAPLAGCTSPDSAETEAVHARIIRTADAAAGTNGTHGKLQGQHGTNHARAHTRTRTGGQEASDESHVTAAGRSWVPALQGNASTLPGDVSAPPANAEGQEDQPGRKHRKNKRSGRHKRGAELPDNPDDPHALRVLTLNAEHLMSPAIFEKWQAFCGPQGWKDRRSHPRPKGLPYCDALNGHDQQGRLIFGPLRTRDDLQAKYRQLAQLVHGAHPDVVLMQEVTDAAAVRAVLGDGWTIHTTAELWEGGAQNSQNLAVAWRQGHFHTEPQVEVIGEISRSTEGRRIRPGLAMYLPFSAIHRISGVSRTSGAPRPGNANQDGEAPRTSHTHRGNATQPAGGTHPVSSTDTTTGTLQTLAILNVHLKAGCRNGRMDRTPSRQPAQQWRRQNACEVLQNQVPAIEGWLDRQIAAGHAVLVSGDFNRNLREEQNRQLPARGDDSPASSPLRRAGDAQRVASVLPELNDGDPVGADLVLIRSGPYRQLAQCHKYIDPFIASRGLGSRLRQPLDALQVRVIPFEAPLSPEQPRPSDHCPHLLALPLR